MSSELRPLAPGTVIAVAGVSFHQLAVERAQIGDAVVLRAELSHPYDPNAVGIYDADNELLGYVPARHDLNRRLRLHHPRGVWGGTIVEKFTWETTGLRVRIETFVGDRAARPYASDNVGYRGTVEPAETPDTDNAEPLAGLAEAGLPGLVRSITGRPLGALVSQANGRVRVRCLDSNQVVAYPASVVRIDA